VSLPFRPRRQPVESAGTPDTGFDQLVLTSYADLCRFCYRITGSRAAAEDIVQDVFAAIWRRGTVFDYGDPLPYLYRAVRNRAISHQRQLRRHGGWLMSWAQERAEHLAPAADPSEVEDLARAIDAAVAALPARRRAIFALHRDQHLTYAEIAVALGISIKTVETQMGRALKALRERLAPYL
jgi:RNA polymerase sigma-70 factor, ECF subfamily